ncbi:hypothetical protein GXM_06833 [Nostoc sphaeroides CCNUC1]|uniref:Uncharacterized protein n=1 Tax=Nostoc sphaeroides CCNUC1 TaxID=2653204 RepID=A0A5P8WBQ1_9NOSO|nr:hypothetical protein GXM_06833 [Nostoc sphaeroides CCNUC1]
MQLVPAFIDICSYLSASCWLSVRCKNRQFCPITSAAL